MSCLRRACALALLALAAITSAAWAEPNFPTLTGRVVDNASLLGADDRAALDSQLAALESKSTDQVVVVTLPSLDGYEIEDYGYKLGNRWGIGQAGKDNGVILIIAPNERKVRIEVGRKLEPLLTDLMSKLIIENAILPAFRRGDFPAGIKAGVRDIESVLLGDAEAVKERAKGGPGGPGPDYAAWIGLAFWITVLALIIYFQIRQAMLAPKTVRQRGRGRYRDTGVIVPAGGGSGSWDGGWSGGSGGGWSGGGGSFGGGGASGGW